MEIQVGYLHLQMHKMSTNHGFCNDDDDGVIVTRIIFSSHERVVLGKE